MRNWKRTKPSSADFTKNMHKDRRACLVQAGRACTVGKTIVQGILDRDLREVRAQVVPNVKRETLQNVVLKNVKHGSTVYTDDAVGYDKLSYNFVHDVVNHAREVRQRSRPYEWLGKLLVAA